MRQIVYEHGFGGAPLPSGGCGWRWVDDSEAGLTSTVIGTKPPFCLFFSSFFLRNLALLSTTFFRASRAFLPVAMST